jgi:hypothetical protein
MNHTHALYATYSKQQTFRFICIHFATTHKDTLNHFDTISDHIAEAGRLPNPYAETPHHHCNSLPRHLTTYAEAGRLPNPYAGRLPITAQHLLRIRCNSCC